MKKLLKITAVLAAIFVVLIIGALITLKMMFPAEKLKSMAQNYAQKELHREITFSDMSFNLIGITLKNFAVSERGTFADGTFLKADKAVAKIALKPLLRKRIEIASVGLEGTDLHVMKGKDGKFNFDDLLSSDATDSETTNQPQTPSSSANFVLTAERIYTTNCNIYYQDLQSGMDASLTKVNLEIRKFSLSEPFQLALNFITAYQNKTGLDVTLPISLTLKVDLAGPDLEQAYATLNNLTLTYKKIKFSALGEVRNFNRPFIKLEGKISGVSNAALADIMPDLPNFALPDITFSTEAQADLQASSAALKQAKLSIHDCAVTAQGTVGWAGSAPTYNMAANIKLNLSQIAAMTNLLDGFGAGGHIDAKLTATDKNDGQDIQGTVTLTDLTVRYQPIILSNLNGMMFIKSLADISSTQLTGNLNGEKFTSSFAYKDLKGVLDLVFNFDLSKLVLTSFPYSSDSAEKTPQETSPYQSEISDLLFNVKANVKLGEITVPYFTSQGATLTANLQKASASMTQANGSVSFTLQEGAVTDLETFLKGNRIVKILMLPLTLVKKVTSKLGIDIFPEKEDKGKIKFSSASGTYIFTNGVMNIQETHFNSSLSNILASGSINFPTQALDMRVSATLLTSQTPIIIKVGGTMNDPSGRLDVTGTAMSLVGGILNYKTPGKVVTGAAELTGDTAKTAMDGTVSAGKTVANAGSEAVKGTVNTAVSAVKGIGNLFKKNTKAEQNSSADQ